MALRWNLLSIGIVLGCSAVTWAIPISDSPKAENDLLVGPSVVEVPSSILSVFPARDFNRNVTTAYWQTGISNEGDDKNAGEYLETLSNASFLAFDKEFYKVLNIKDYTTPKEIENIFDFPAGPKWANRMVHDGTVYSPECNCLFAAELYPPKKGYSMQFLPWVWRTNLNGSRPVTEKVYPNPPLTIANGAYYHNGSIYWAQEGNYTTPGAIVQMNPLTLETKVVLNNYLGHRFNSLNDVVIAKSGVAYFTDGYYGYDNFNDTVAPEMANGVWRWDMKTGNVRMIAGAGTGVFINPNGLALDHQEKTLYITARGFTSADANGTRNIYHYDLTASNGRLGHVGLFSYMDAGFSDGIKVDDRGYVYGGVTGSVDVWNKEGTLIGKMKVAADDVAVNMAWVGSWLYIYSRNSIYRVKLGAKGAQSV